MSAPLILKLGGSLVVPKEIDTGYLSRFLNLIRKHTRRGKRFVVIVGGGHTCRLYRNAAIALGVKNEKDLHWIGTVSTQMNAEFVRSVFGDLAHPRTYCDYSKKINWLKPVLVVGGYGTGHSTDHDAVLMAKKFKAKRVINITNVPALYTKDPKKHKDAKPIREISWKDYRGMFGNLTKHAPGQNIPIDAIAALNSQRLRLETFYVSGKDLDNLDNLLSGKEWRGTRIF